MRVIIADDTVPFARGLADMLAEIGIETIAIARDADELAAAVAATPPDVAIIDISMPPTFAEEGLFAAEELGRTHPAVGVLVMTAYDEEGWAARLLHHRSGKVGYLRKRNLDNIAVVRDALRRIMEGGVAIDNDVATRALSQRSVVQRLAALTDRERAVLQQMAEGRSNGGIGDCLNISERTVEKHVTRIFEKLGLTRDEDQNQRVRAVLEWLAGKTT